MKGRDGVSGERADWAHARQQDARIDAWVRAHPDAVCSRCHKWYPAPPANPVCECGGQIVTSLPWS